MDYERRADGSGRYTHKRLVREILGLPVSTPAEWIDSHLSRNNDHHLHRSRRVMLCPSSNTIAGPPAKWWLQLADVLAKRGLEPVINSSSAASSVSDKSKFDNGFSRFSTFTGTVSEFVREVAGYRGVITARSGLCEILALAGVSPYVVASQQKVSDFWRLGDGFGVEPMACVATADSAAMASLQGLIEDWSSAAP
jgi:hypothetical protein